MLSGCTIRQDKNSLRDGILISCPSKREPLNSFHIFSYLQMTEKKKNEKLVAIGFIIIIIFFSNIFGTLFFFFFNKFFLK